MMTLLTAAAPQLKWAAYCGLTSKEQLVWEERGDELNKSMLYLMNSKKKHAKKDLVLAYSQGNLMGYSPSIKGMATCLFAQYHNNKLAKKRNGKKGIQIREMIQNLKTMIVTRVTLQVHTTEILEQMKNLLFLVEGLVLMLTFWRQINNRPDHHVLWRIF